MTTEIDENSAGSKANDAPGGDGTNQQGASPSSLQAGADAKVRKSRASAVPKKRAAKKSAKKKAAKKRSAIKRTAPKKKGDTSGTFGALEIGTHFDYLERGQTYVKHDARAAHHVATGNPISLEETAAVLPATVKPRKETK